MGALLILTGVACLVAAIVGGGVKLHSIEVGGIASLWRQILLGLLGVILCVWGASESGSQPDSGSSDSGMNLTDNLAQDLADTNLDATSNGNMAEDTGDAGALVENVTGDGEATVRSLWVKNGCPWPIDLWLVTHEAGGWTNYGEEYWTIQPGTTYPTYKDQKLKPDQSEIYYKAQGRDNWTWEGTYTHGNLTNLAKINLSPEADGDYALKFSCN